MDDKDETPFPTGSRVPSLEKLEGCRILANGIYLFAGLAGTLRVRDSRQFLEDVMSGVPRAVKGEPLPKFEPIVVPGSHPSLQMRGNDLARDKMFWQDLAPRSVGYLLKYWYTGWQWAVAAATSGVEQTPLVGAFFHHVKDFMTKNGGIAPNHVIATRYKGGKHYIGWHSDKIESLDEEGWIVVFKFGAPRQFGIRMPGAAAFFYETLQPGDALIMTIEANKATQHTVPKMLLSEPSGSIVFRTVKTKVDLRVVEEKIAQRTKTTQNKIAKTVSFKRGDLNH